MAIKLDEARVRLLKITDTNGNKHISFSRNSYNYIAAPSNGVIGLIANDTLSSAGCAMVIATSSVYPGTTNAVNLGTSSQKWANVYATTFNGALSGNATSATKATQDGSGNTITSTYLKLSGGTMTGSITMNVNTGLQMKYEAGKDTPWIYPNGANTYGIRYLEGSPDKMMISASGNNSTAAGADLCINGNGDGTVTIRGKTILHAGNYTSYTVTKTGSGASGNSWAIGITGNAATATTASKTQAALSLNGKSFNGSTAIDMGTLGVAYGGTGRTSLVTPTVTWTNGSSSGPTLTIKDSLNKSSTAVAIPAASDTISGIITTEAQTIVGAKTIDGIVLKTHRFMHDMTPTAGWYRIAKLQYYQGYFNLLLFFHGGYNNGRPSTAVVHLSGEHNTPSLKQIAGDANSFYTKVRLVGTSSTYYLEIYSGATGGSIGSQYVSFLGVGSISAVYTPTTPDGATSTYNAEISLRTMKDTVTFAVADNSATNTGAAVTCTGSDNIVLKLPATIKASLSGNASTATALTSNAGSQTLPVYFYGGKPSAITALGEESSPLDNIWAKSVYITNTSYPAFYLVAGTKNSGNTYSRGVFEVNYTDSVGMWIQSDKTTDTKSRRALVLYGYKQKADASQAIALRQCDTSGNWQSDLYVLHSGNYSSYALPKSGGTLSGSITISHAASATMDSTTTNPRIVFSANGSQSVGLVYTNYDSYRSPAGLKVMDMTGSNGNVWFEVTGEIIAGTKVTAPSFVGALTGNVIGNVSGSSGSCTGNSATATKVKMASTGISATATTDALLEAGVRFDTVAAGGTSINNDGVVATFGYSASWGAQIFLDDGAGAASMYIRNRKSTSSWNPWRRVWVSGDSVTGAVWNDYAEYRESDCKEFGRVLAEKGDDTLTKTTKRLQPFAGVSSDTWGFCQGETEKAKTPIAVAGRVLVYTYRNRKEYKPGDVVCAAQNGTVDIMTREEIIKYPDRIVGTVSCVPEYETWGSGDRDPVKVGNRIWIKVR